ncbi:MAG TPA: hypothetical protein VG963_10085 [Polyangiaceae bacterium]|nr:hypothetical protein [Polyangiaceae bacterium]
MTTTSEMSEPLLAAGAAAAVESSADAGSADAGSAVASATALGAGCVGAAGADSADEGSGGAWAAPELATKQGPTPSSAASTQRAHAALLPPHLARLSPTLSAPRLLIVPTNTPSHLLGDALRVTPTVHDSPLNTVAAGPLTLPRLSGADPSEVRGH